MGFGGGGQKVPDPEPIPQVPQKDSPNADEVARQEVTRAKNQEGYSKHLLSGPKGDTSDPGVTRKSLIG